MSFSAVFLAAPFFKRFAFKPSTMPPAQPKPEATHWAILIGVDFYGNSQDNALQGAVNDVKAMGAFFTQWPHVKVSMLTASRPDEEGQDIPSEDPQDQATTENLSAVLEEVKREGSLEKIKHVYIHFSGHGKRNKEGELCLGLYRPNPSLSLDFTAGMLREAIDKMISQDMEVTLVLDCCFSAGVKRTGHVALGQVRFFEDVPRMEEGKEPKCDTPSPQDISKQLQSASLRADLFLDARGYTIITACGQDEQTREIKVGNERMGALSHFLLRSLQLLKSEGSQATLTTLHESLQNQFRSVGLNHVPRRYGSSNICFFESLLPGPNAVLTSVFFDDNTKEYILNAGQAHGVCVGDRYEVTAWRTSEDVESQSEEQPDEFVVGTTRSLDSVIKLIGSPKEDDPKLRSGKAKPVGFSSRQKITVHITDSMPQADREQLRQNLSGNPVLEVSTTEKPLDLPTFNVELDADDSFRVLDGAAEPIPNVPCIQRSAEDYMDSLIRTLEHLARYKFLRGLKNLSPDAEFEKLFSLTCVDDSGDDGRYHITDGETWQLNFENMGNEPLFVHIFNMCSSWSVTDIIRDEGDDLDGFEVAPGSKFPLCLEMEIPEQHLPRTEDVLKFIVTRKPTPFPLLSLPEIGDSGTARGSDGFNEFHDFIFSGPGAMRNDRDAKWSTKTFTIVISSREASTAEE
ncbi:hypothetical protein CEP54_010524 [Fusarium duplospermum]|uniref:Peptidase C14 caspase domain-containing protein n=1 Tax=Fusarium duplospermum TaxID=1325734 RepID=A0A428PJW3_9HYPO|nr:hypothetical protein CEP54_010524 [Fusarium duplospermum]